MKRVTDPEKNRERWVVFITKYSGQFLVVLFFLERILIVSLTKVIT